MCYDCTQIMWQLHGNSSCHFTLSRNSLQKSRACAGDNVFALLTDASGWSAEQIRRHNLAIQIASAAINWLDSWKRGQESKPVHGNDVTPHRKLNGKPIKFFGNETSHQCCPVSCLVSLTQDQWMPHVPKRYAVDQPQLQYH